MGQTIEPNSPFSKTNFQAFEDYSVEGSLHGLLLPNGEVLVNYEHNTSTKTLFGIARQLGAQVIVIKGEWTFHPVADSVKLIKVPE